MIRHFIKISLNERQRHIHEARLVYYLLPDLGAEDGRFPCALRE